MLGRMEGMVYLVERGYLFHSANSSVHRLF